MNKSESSRLTPEDSQALVTVREDVIRFLLGEAAFDGHWFGEKPLDKPMFWWRTPLRISMQADLYDSFDVPGNEHNPTAAYLAATMPPHITQSERMQTFAPDAVIAKIVEDIRGRMGLGDEWANIDVDTRNEIVATWRGFFGERTFSDFIRNATPEEKEAVYTDVMKRATDRQNSATPSAGARLRRWSMWVGIEGLNPREDPNGAYVLYSDLATQSASEPINGADTPLCDGHAAAWFTERNHLEGDTSCVVCAFQPCPPSEIKR